ncbi:MFS transporter [Streptomyces sp. NPDC016459]|uniref:MFS transporter n=1 Tax=Streptomyces sp. NPDC016459 TaxID=3157190 RepID=UPI00340C76EE
MKRYTLYSGSYRFFSGVVLLLLNWHIASSQGGGYDALAIATALSFVPAVFVPPLVRFSPIAGGARMTAAGLAGVSLTLLLIAAGYDHVHVLVALNFVLWIFFFFLESTWEVWFNDEASGLDGATLRRHSSLTMTVNQVALMVGPLFAPLFTRVVSAQWVLVGCAVLFAGVAVLSLGSHRTETTAEQLEKEARPQGAGSLKALYLLAFLLIWPILGTFNFMLPLQALAHDQGMLTVGIMDMILGIGMAVAGTFLHRLTKSLGVGWVLTGAVGAVTAAIAVWLLLPAFGVPQMVAIFALGCAFGSLRVILRAEAASAFSPRQVGSIVANANACSLVLLAAVLAGGRLVPSLIWLAPFVLTLLLVLAFHRIRRAQGKSSGPIPTEVSV